MRQIGSVLWPKLRILQIYGANTGVGKTIFSSIICRAFKKRLQNVNYLKPVSTGPLDEADDHHISILGAGVRSKCLFQFDDPVSPHLAARAMGKTLPDEAVLEAVFDELKSNANGEEGISIVETAGGVLSPSPSGSSQADLYRPLRLPTLLVGDYQLGGIGTTISAWESLHIRGYDVESVALFTEDRYGNHAYLKDYFRDRQISTFAIKPPPERHEITEEDVKAMKSYYEISSQEAGVQRFVDQFLTSHNERIEQIKSMPEEADKAVWHPFLQHTERTKDTIMAWDSAYGDSFQSYTTKQEAETSSTTSETSVLKPAFDGSASWWTQGLGHGNPALALTAANAAGRYGHVMFGGAIHKPGLDLARTLIEESGNPRLNKVFYSDNGSTGMEVAVKMALRSTMKRYGETSMPEKEHSREGTRMYPVILGLKNSYHGDTIGTMDCSEPSIFNEKVEWYKGRGVWLDFPTVKMRNGTWQVEMHPDFVEWQKESSLTTMESARFESLSDVFDLHGRQELYNMYWKFLSNRLQQELQTNESFRLAALIIEPVILGAGGMLFADPLFQKALVDVARTLYQSPTWDYYVAPPSSQQHSTETDWKGVPVIFDEVFTGLYRLGRFSAASFIQTQPDIVVNAKLLTGGLLPLCTTTASKSIFEAFLSHDKTDALLHGHSYTAHPVGCSVANESLRQLQHLDRSDAWTAFREDWRATATTSSSSSSPSPSAPGEAWSMWSTTFLRSISSRPGVDSVFALGSVLAISLKDPNGSGYASTAATGLRDQLMRGREGQEGVVHSRVLGNVLYLMAAMTTKEGMVRELERRVEGEL